MKKMKLSGSDLVAIILMTLIVLAGLICAVVIGLSGLQKETQPVAVITTPTNSAQQTELPAAQEVTADMLIGPWIAAIKSEYGICVYTMHFGADGSCSRSSLEYQPCTDGVSGELTAYGQDWYACGGGGRWGGTYWVEDNVLYMEFPADMQYPEPAYISHPFYLQDGILWIPGSHSGYPGEIGYRPGSEIQVEYIYEVPTVSEESMRYTDYLAAEMGSYVTVVTYVQAMDSWWNGYVNLYTQNEDGAYYIYNMACTEEDAAKFAPGTKLMISGTKTEWSGLVEIIDATYEILEGNFLAPLQDVTHLMHTDLLQGWMNHKVLVRGLTVLAAADPNGNEHPYLYKWNGDGERGDSIYLTLHLNGNVYSFAINAYMLGTGPDSAVYQAAESLQAGDVIDVEGFLYWYEGPQLHITSLTVRN